MMQRIKKTYQSKRVYRIEKAFQTEKYKLNLIEPTDPFLPDALNANTQRVEDVLIDKMEGPVVDLEQRVSVLEARHFAFGTYAGNGATNDSTKYLFVALPFAPKVVIVGRSGGGSGYSLTELVTTGEGGYNSQLILEETGFRIAKYLNTTGSVYNYIAFG